MQGKGGESSFIQIHRWWPGDYGQYAYGRAKRETHVDHHIARWDAKVRATSIASTASRVWQIWGEFFFVFCKVKNNLRVCGRFLIAQQHIILFFKIKINVYFAEGSRITVKPVGGIFCLYYNLFSWGQAEETPTYLRRSGESKPMLLQFIFMYSIYFFPTDHQYKFF